MGSPDYVGAVHQVLDGTMLALAVSADFLCGGVIVDYDVARGGVIVRSEVAVVDVTAGSEVAEGGMMVRCQATVLDMIMGRGFAGTRGRTSQRSAPAPRGDNVWCV